MAWGGARKGAGRKPKPEPTVAETPAPSPPELADKTAVEILDEVARALFARGNLIEASKAAARAEAARARAAALERAPGKRQQRQDAADRVSSGRFAPPPPPGGRPN